MKIYAYRLISSLVALLLLTGAAYANQNAPGLKDTEKSKENVRVTIQSYVAGRQARDIEAVKGVLDPKVDQLTSRGEWRRGIDAATAGMKKSSKKNPGKRSIKVESVRFLHPDVALADARYTIKGTDGRPDRILWSSFTLVRNSNGKWLITSIRNQKPAK